MFEKVLCAIFTVLVVQRVQCTGLLKVTASYIAWGEITELIDGVVVQVAFEESYDADSQNSAFIVQIAGKNTTFIQNFKTNQTFRYTDGKDCALTDETEWTQMNYPPGLLPYEDGNGNMKFALGQLLNIPDRYLVDKTNVPTVYRSIPARMWHYEVKGRDKNGNSNTFSIDAYWSDETWNTSSNEKSVPLGFKIEKSGINRDGNKLATEEIMTSVFGFVTGTYESKYFEPIPGVICANRMQTRKFPIVRNIQAISIFSEMVLPDYQQIKYIDTYFDPRNQLIRIDVERIRGADPIAERKSKRYVSEIAVGNMGVVFRQSVFKDQFSCALIPFKQYLNDIQNFIDIKQNLANWNMEKLFGVNGANYVYTGKTVKSDIPCHVFQGIRTDWPEESANVKSLWEWCFNINMSKENENVYFLHEVGLINAQVTILTSGKPQDYPPGFRMYHHFYEVSAIDPDILDTTKFDISRCFDENFRLALQFLLEWNITDDNRHLAENLTSDVSFLQTWKSDIYMNTGLPMNSLRIAKLKATIADEKMYIKFLILSDYQPATEDGTKHISLADAEKTLRENVNKGNLEILHTVEKKMLTFKAVPNSLTLQLNPDFNHHTIPPPPITETTTTSTKLPFTLKTEAPPDDKKRTIKHSGHQPGIVAAVSVTMLLVGIFAGTAGAFYKYFGLPSYCRR